MISPRLFFATLLTLCLQSTFLHADTGSWPVASSGDIVTPIYSSEGMVVAAERLASEVGAQILAEGGNAVDAAVATGFALAVTLPSAGNIGGGGFMLVHRAAENETIAVDYREMAPGGASRDMYLDDEGNVDKARIRTSHLASGVPGTVAGLLHAHQRFGLLSRQQVMKPAIALAADGFPMNYTTWSMMERVVAYGNKRMYSNDAARRYYYKADGSSYKTGETIRLKDLAWSLGQIAEHGADAFYRGAVAEKLIAEMELGGGLINAKDLANYRVIEREPVWGSFHGYRLASMPPPSSGGVHIVQMMNVLETYDLRAMGHNSADYVHTVAESMRVAYADRSRYLGDPDFYPVPIDRLTDKAYAKRIRAGIDPAHARPSSELAPGAYLSPESPQTTQISVADRHGNLVSNTYTLNGAFGSGIAVNGAGFLLNNEMDDFSAKPGTANMFSLIGEEANAIEPRKRPLSSMSPTIVFKGDKPFVVTGSPNGSRIITGVLQNLLNMLAFDMNVAVANAQPRFHHQWKPDLLQVEDGFSADTLTLLRARGHEIVDARWSVGMVQSIMIIDGVMAGAADTRRVGATVSSPETLRGIH